MTTQTSINELVEEILDVCIQQRRDDASIVIRDRIEKDVVRPLERELLQAYRERDALKSAIRRYFALDPATQVGLWQAASDELIRLSGKEHH